MAMYFCGKDRNVDLGFQIHLQTLNQYYSPLCYRISQRVVPKFKYSLRLTYKIFVCQDELFTFLRSVPWLKQHQQ